MIRFELALIVSTATAAADAGLLPRRAVRRRSSPCCCRRCCVLAWSGLRGGDRGGGWAAVVAVGVFLGVAALFYTLLLGYAAFTRGHHGRASLAIARRSRSTRCCGSPSSR